jgi:hypothetical protein
MTRHRLARIVYAHAGTLPPMRVGKRDHAIYLDARTCDVETAARALRADLIVNYYA